MEEYDDWNEPLGLGWSTFSTDIEMQLLNKLRDDDYFIRKQTLSEALIYLQNPASALSVRQVLDAIKAISKDYEPSLRSDLAEALVSIYRLCCSTADQSSTETVENSDTTTTSEAPWSLLSSFVIPTIVVFLGDSNKQVRMYIHSGLIQLLQEKTIDKELFLAEIFPTMQELMEPCNLDEWRSECFTLLVQLSQLLGNCLEEHLLTYSREFLATNDNLRKTCASYLSSIINHASDVHVVNWLDIYYKLSEDNSWYVRKFCIESSASFAKRVSHEERWSKIAETYHKFLTDTKKWVFTAALQHLGELVATYADSTKTHCCLDETGYVVNNSAQAPPPSSDQDSDESSHKFSCPSYWQTPIDPQHLNSASVVTTSNVDVQRQNHMRDRDVDSFFTTLSLSDPVSNRPQSLTQLYKQTIVPPQLIEDFINTINENKDVDVLRPCAFSIPAVLYVLGPNCWPYMRQSYLTLLQSMSWKVRLSLASSLHHVFEIFKREPNAVSDLVSVYEDLIKDVDEIKVGLVGNVSRLFLALPVSVYSRVFSEDLSRHLVHTESPKNWRYRVTCMQQLGLVLGGCSRLLPPGAASERERGQLVRVLREQWRPVVERFLADSVFAVRAAALDVVIEMLQQLQSWAAENDWLLQQESLLEMRAGLLTHVAGLADSKVWYMRQLFLQACQLLMAGSAPVLASLLPAYLRLCGSDPVPNNRMVGGHGLAVLLACIDNFMDNQSPELRTSVADTRQRLLADSDRDVRESLGSEVASAVKEHREDEEATPPEEVEEKHHSSTQ